MATSSLSSTMLNASQALRLTGLASGMDTESMVNSLMKAERAKYDKLIQQKTLLEWRSDANLEVNNLLKEFRDTYLSLANPSKTMLSSSSVLAYKVTADTNNSVVLTANGQAYPGAHRIDSITSLATGANVKSDSTVGSLAAGEDGRISFKINGQTFSFTSLNTLQDIIYTVNSNKDANVTMSYSSLTGKVSIASKKLGSASSLTIENISGNAFSDENSALGIRQGAYANGTDAVLRIDGVDVTRDTNSFTIDGINYSLKNTAAAPIDFSVEQDVDAAVDRIKAFVDAYNTLVDKLQNKLDEKYDSSYKPLTDDQRSSMSDAQVEQWEKKAKTGLLQSDSDVSRLLSDMRKAFFDNVQGAGINATSIGLSTMSYLTQGKIQVDEAKLRKALQDNPQQVNDVLTKTFFDDSVSTQYQNSGLASRINDTINRYLNDYTGYRQDTREAISDDLDNRITREQTRLTDREDRYWDQFNRMEQAIAQLNSQSNWLSQQFSSSNG